MANRFPLIVKSGQTNTIEELSSGDNLDLTGNGIIVDSDKVLSLPQVTTTLVGTNTSQTLSNKVLTLPKIGDTTGDHFYQFAVGELDGTRTITLPILSGNDEFVFKDHTQTLTNKTLTSPTINNPTIDAAAGSLVLPQGAAAAQTAEGSIFWDTDDNILTIGTATGRKTIVDTDSTQSLSGKTINNLILTGTLTADGSAGTNNYVLKSTGTGVQWVQSSDAIAITDTTNATGTVYPLLVSETTGTLVDVDILTTKFSIDGPTGDITLGSTTPATSSAGALKVAGGIRGGNLHITGSSAVTALSETSITYATGSSSVSTGAFSVSFAVTAVNAYGETIGTATSSRYYSAGASPTSHTATITWSAVTGATSYKVYRKTSFSTSWFLVETVPSANTRTHSSTFTTARTTSLATANASGGAYAQIFTYYYYLSVALSPVNGTSSGTASTPRTLNTTAVFPLDVVGTINATSLRLSAATPLLNSSGSALEFTPKYNRTIYTGDGTTTNYSLSAAMAEDEIFVTVGGVPQTPGSSYSYYTSGSTLIFTEAPNPDDRIVIRYNVYKVRGGS
jgi:hypothetical protein